MAFARRKRPGQTLQTLLDAETRDPSAVRAQYARFLDAAFAEPEGLSDSDRLHVTIRYLYQKFRLFDEAFYRRRYLSGLRRWHDPAGAPKGLNPLDHYVFYGRRVGHAPNALVDPGAYLAACPDVAEAGFDPVLHLALIGWREGREAGSRVDSAAYLAAYADVAAAGISPLVHYMGFGRFENRAPRPGPGTPRIAAPPPAARAAAPTPASVPAAAPARRGTLLLVSHDAGLGGAQKLVRVLAEWLLAATRHDIRIVVMKDGGLRGSFEAIAPTFNVAAHPPETVAAELAAFAGEDVRAVVLNSVASGGFLDLWPAPTPVVAYIHELPRLLAGYRPELALIAERAARIVGGSEAVRTALAETLAEDAGKGPDKVPGKGLGKAPGLPAGRLAAVHGFIEVPDPGTLAAAADKAAARAAVGIGADDFLVTGCGVLHWRKAPEIFIETARLVLARADADPDGPAAGRPLRFVWVGGGPDQEACQRLIDAAGLGARVSLTGYAADIMPWLAASDLFLLPSLEDPFPLVCLYAAAMLNPIVCFADAGGMPELVGRGCGTVVPLGDAEAMAGAVAAYAADPERTLAQGRAGRDLVLAHHTVAHAGPLLLEQIRQAADLVPRVSVVVPNYNYDRFLAQRLDTIAAQTFQDFEVILLDDASTDGSVARMRAWAEGRPATRLVANEANSGSPFRQWIRGIDLARAELIWIAEADDFSDPGFLARMVRALDDRNVALAYARSAPVDVEGRVMGDYGEIYLDRIAPGRWSSDYTVTDHREVNAGLGIANCIPNASSVVFRRFAIEPELAATLTAMRMCGDWLFYLRAIRGGLVAYAAETLNLHRRHDSTVTAQTEGSLRYFDEFAEIRHYVGKNYRLEPAARARIEAFTRQDLDRFGVTGAAERAAILDRLPGPDQAKALPTLMVVAPDLSPGGGQMFAVRLANEWARRGGRVALVNVHRAPDHPRVVSLIDSRVAVFEAADIGRDFAGFCAGFDIDVIHSTIWWSDRFVDSVIDRVPDMPWITTMHGCHETILRHPAVDPGFPDRIGRMLGRIDAWVHTADKNREVFDRFGEPPVERRIRNGVEDRHGTPLDRAALGLRADAVVLCLASRAIRDKGWMQAIEITRRLNAAGNGAGRAVDLMLIGEGPAADMARDLEAPHVRLYGQVDNLADYLATADIAILPSSFVGESLPLVLLEAMAQGRPVVATGVGEIPDLVGRGRGKAGAVVPLRAGRVEIAGFVAALAPLVRDARARATRGRAARRRFEKDFTIGQMVDSYAALYAEAIAARAPAAVRAGPDAARETRTETRAATAVQAKTQAAPRAGAGERLP